MKSGIYRKLIYLIYLLTTFFYLYKFSRVNQNLGVISKEFQSDDKFIVIENITNDKFKNELEDKLRLF